MLEIQKWGNSHAIRFPKHLLDMVHLQEGDKLDVLVEEERLILDPVRKKKRKKYRLEDLVSRIKPGHYSKEVDWGEKQGREVW